MPFRGDRRPWRSYGNRRLAARDQGREDGAELAVSVTGTACEHEPQTLTRDFWPCGDAWVRRVEADKRVGKASERAGGRQEAGFVGRDFPHAACMSPQRGRKCETTPFDSEGIGH